MTKKHFTAIAEILKNSNDKKQIITELARFCKTQNSNFDTYRFKKACGLSDNEC